MTVLHDIGSGKMDRVELFNRMFLNVPQRRTRHTQLLYVPMVRTNYEANDMTFKPRGLANIRNTIMKILSVCAVNEQTPQLSAASQPIRTLYAVCGDKSIAGELVTFDSFSFVLSTNVVGVLGMDWNGF
ncbi:hypothetical protein ACJJTC_017855 [Scirpophaga incertulas]